MDAIPVAVLGCSLGHDPGVALLVSQSLAGGGPRRTEARSATPRGAAATVGHASACTVAGPPTEAKPRRVGPQPRSVGRPHGPLHSNLATIASAPDRRSGDWSGGGGGGPVELPTSSAPPTNTDPVPTGAARDLLLAALPCLGLWTRAEKAEPEQRAREGTGSQSPSPTNRVTTPASFAVQSPIRPGTRAAKAVPGNGE